jgi:aldehyde dehydrogenase (NAD+)
VSEEAAAKSASPRVSDAIARGARLLMGDVRADALYLPTVADRRRPSSIAWRPACGS